MIIRSLTTLVLLLTLASTAISISACGYRGPLYLPDESSDSTTAEEQAESEDREKKKSDR